MGKSLNWDGLDKYLSGNVPAPKRDPKAEWAKRYGQPANTPAAGPVKQLAVRPSRNMPTHRPAPRQVYNPFVLDGSPTRGKTEMSKALMAAHAPAKASSEGSSDG